MNETERFVANQGIDRICEIFLNKRVILSKYFDYGFDFDQNMLFFVFVKIKKQIFFLYFNQNILLLILI